MAWHKQLKSLKEIPDKDFNGYLWLSDESIPKNIKNVSIQAYEEDGNPTHPFIREAYLFNEEEQISVSVQHIPGRYLIHLFDLKELPANCEITEQKILAHKQLGKKLIFKEIWIPEEDVLCMKWPVLTKKVSVFCGIES